jgi:hypothetical protein
MAVRAAAARSTQASCPAAGWPEADGQPEHDHQAGREQIAGEVAEHIPLIAHVDGISPAAGHRATSEQESVLAFMREATTAAHTQF